MTPDYIPIQSAVEKHGIHKNTIRSYIAKGKIQAKRQGESPKSPWLVFEPSLVAVIGKTRKSSPELSEQKPHDDPAPPRELPTEAPAPELSLRDSSTAIDQKIEEVSAIPKNAGGAPPKPTTPPKKDRRHPRRSRPHGSPNRHHSRQGDTQQRRYSIKITPQQLKDVVRHMPLNEQVSFRDWCNDFLKKVLNL